MGQAKVRSEVRVMINVDWRTRVLVAALVALPVISWAAQSPTGQHWPQWRGPEGNGVTHATGLSRHWNEQEGLAWKSAIPEWGTSTPVIWENSIFLTSHVDDRDLVLVKLDKRNGAIQWTREVGSATTPRRNRCTNPVRIVGGRSFTLPRTWRRRHR